MSTTALRSLAAALAKLEKTLGREIQRAEQKPDAGRLHGADVDRAVRDYMQRTGEKSYSAALIAVTKADSNLAREYAAVGADARDAHRRDSFDPKYRDRQQSGDSSAGLPRERVSDQATAQIDRGEAGAEVHKRTMELMRTPEYRGISYEQALTAVLQLDPDLASRYRQFAGDYSDMPWQGQGG
jgi:hypothetical protein